MAPAVSGKGPAKCFGTSLGTKHPRLERHIKATHCNSTLATDGKRTSRCRLRIVFSSTWTGSRFGARTRQIARRSLRRASHAMGFAITPPEMGATNQFVARCHARKGNYLQTPTAVGDLLWGCLDNGVVTCFRSEDGATPLAKRPAVATRLQRHRSRRTDAFISRANRMCSSLPPPTSSPCWRQSTRRHLAVHPAISKASSLRTTKRCWRLDPMRSQTEQAVLPIRMTFQHS